MSQTVLLGALESEVGGAVAEGDRLWIPLGELPAATGWAAEAPGAWRGRGRGAGRAAARRGLRAGAAGAARGMDRRRAARLRGVRGAPRPRGGARRRARRMGVRP